MSPPADCRRFVRDTSFTGVADHRGPLAVVLRNVADGITAQAPRRRARLRQRRRRAAAAGSDPPRSCSSLARRGAARSASRSSARTGGRSRPSELPNRRALARARPRGGLLGYRILPDGEERWSVVRSTPILAEDGAVRARDQRLPRRHRRAPAQERVRFLAEASTRLRRVARLSRPPSPTSRALLVPRLADYCIVDAARGRQPAPGRDLAPRPRARAAAARAPRAATRPTRTRRIRSREVLRTGAPLLIEDARDEALERPRSTRSTSRSTARSTPPRTSSSRSRRAAACSGRSRSAPASRAASSGGRPRARARDRAPRGARDRQRAPLRRRPGVVRAARHAARLRAGRDRLLGPRPPLRPRQRRARGDEPAHAGGARRPRRSSEVIPSSRRCSSRSTGTCSRPASPSCTRSRPTRASQIGRRAPLALELLPGPHARAARRSASAG